MTWWEFLGWSFAISVGLILFMVSMLVVVGVGKGMRARWQKPFPGDRPDLRIVD
jgi:hypothetical protein